MYTVEEKYRQLTLLLIKKGLTITTMESCTSGEIASLITDTEGSSAVLKGAFVTYSNQAKILQGVVEEIIDKYGVYSKETAESMCEACRNTYGADLGIGVTGSLGNIDPNNSDSVPGEIFYGISYRGKVQSYFAKLPVCSSRHAYKLAAAELVVDRLLEILKVQEERAKAVRLIGLDMDGTLVDLHENLPVDFFDWVKSHPMQHVVIASGRQYYTLRDNMAEARDRIILMADNGACIMRGDQLIYSNFVAGEDARKILAIAEEHDTYHVVLACEKTAYMLDTDPKELIDLTLNYYHKIELTADLKEKLKDNACIKIAVFVENHAAEEALASFADLPAHLHSMLSGDSWIDIQNASVNKGVGMEAIRKSLGIKKEETMVFGDYLNDMSMFLTCQESYAMGNGHPALKKAAKYVTRSNAEDGVMHILRMI